MALKLRNCQNEQLKGRYLCNVVIEFYNNTKIASLVSLYTLLNKI